MPMLHLDAARMGRMSPSSQQALQHFVRFAGEIGATLYFEEFLSRGWAGLPPDWRRSHPGLQFWRGAHEFKKSLSRLVRLPHSGSVFLANRTAKLCQMAAGLLLRKCRRVLITDLTWPAYARIMTKEARRSGGRLVSLSLRSSILEQGATANDVVAAMVSRYERQGCDGLFVPEVSHDGIRLPVGELATALAERIAPTFLAVDGAQCLGHLPVDLASANCDFYFGGCHKWLAAYLPLGVAFCPKGAANLPLRAMLPCVDDPLLDFLTGLDEGNKNGQGETVNVLPLFTGQAALNDVQAPARTLKIRQANATRFVEVLSAAWRPVLPHPSLRTGIVLLKATGRACGNLNAERIRSFFLAAGIALTAYPGGLLRLSMPSMPWTSEELQILSRIFQGGALASMLGDEMSRCEIAGTRDRKGTRHAGRSDAPFRTTRNVEIDLGPTSKSREPAQ